MRRLGLLLAIGAIAFAACGFPQPADVLPPPVDAFVAPIDAPHTVMTPPPSCVGLAQTCGSGVDCCTSVHIPSATYDRSFDAATDGMFSDMTHPATVSDFHLDKFEVTVGRFRAFVMAGKGLSTSAPAANDGAHAKIPGSGWDASFDSMLPTSSAALMTSLNCDSMFATWTDSVGANENRPINCITWFEAMAFCAYDGGFLPTEAEWNLAATGTDQRAFPWSSPPGSVNVDGTFASFKNGNDCTGDSSMSGCTSVTDLIEVGTKPDGDSPLGNSDLGGNVAEWVLDAAATTYADPCTDCADLSLTAMGRIQRGGSFHGTSTEMRTGARAMVNPTPTPPFNGDPFSGVRCARPL